MASVFDCLNSSAWPGIAARNSWMASIPDAAAPGRASAAGVARSETAPGARRDMTPAISVDALAWPEGIRSSAGGASVGLTAVRGNSVPEPRFACRLGNSCPAKGLFLPLSGALFIQGNDSARLMPAGAVGDWVSEVCATSRTDLDSVLSFACGFSHTPGGGGRFAAASIEASEMTAVVAWSRGDCGSSGGREAGVSSGTGVCVGGSIRGAETRDESLGPSNAACSGKDGDSRGRRMARAPSGVGVSAGVVGAVSIRGSGA